MHGLQGLGDEHSEQLADEYGTPLTRLQSGKIRRSTSGVPPPPILTIATTTIHCANLTALQRSYTKHLHAGSKVTSASRRLRHEDAVKREKQVRCGICGL